MQRSLHNIWGSGGYLCDTSQEMDLSLVGYANHRLVWNTVYYKSWIRYSGIDCTMLQTHGPVQVLILEAVYFIINNIMNIKLTKYSNMSRAWILIHDFIATCVFLFRLSFLLKLFKREYGFTLLQTYQDGKYRARRILMITNSSKALWSPFIHHSINW